jgi:hypothetical protein
MCYLPLGVLEEAESNAQDIYWKKLAMVAHTCNPHHRQADPEFKASLGYPVSKNINKKINF